MSQECSDQEEFANNSSRIRSFGVDEGDDDLKNEALLKQFNRLLAEGERIENRMKLYSSRSHNLDQPSTSAMHYSNFNLGLDEEEDGELIFVQNNGQGSIHSDSPSNLNDSLMVTYNSNVGILTNDLVTSMINHNNHVHNFPASHSNNLPEPLSYRNNSLNLESTSNLKQVNNNSKYGKSPEQVSKENYTYVSLEHANASFPIFREMWQRNQVCDLTIVVGDRKFFAHKIVLCATIPYFYAMFTNEMAEKTRDEIILKTGMDKHEDEDTPDCETPSLDPSAFEALLRYAYTGSIQINSSSVQSLLIGASFLGLVNVQHACADYLKIRLNVSNVLNVIRFATALGCGSLALVCKSYIYRHFESVAKTAEFLSLDFDDLCEIVDTDELNIYNEQVVFEAVLAWTKHDQGIRLERLPDLLVHVRLPLLSPEYLCDCVLGEPLIRQSLACRDLVDEAKDFHLMPNRRDEMSKFKVRSRYGHKVQGSIFVVGGLTRNGDSMSTVEMYDSYTKRWRIVEAMTMLRSRVGVAVMDGKLYAIGGYNGRERLATVEVYDAKQRKWTKVTPMNNSRSAVGAASLNGYLYVCGGYDGKESLSIVERYSALTDSWQLMSNTIFRRSAAGVVAFDGYIYALGGHDGIMIFSSVERYDPATNEWEIVEPMLTRRCRLGVAIMSGKIYVCGGYDGCKFLQSAEVFDPKVGKWKMIAPMKGTRSRVALVANGNRLFAIGGYNGITNLSSVEAYHPETDTWDYAASMVAHEGGVGVGVIPDN